MYANQQNQAQPQNQQGNQQGGFRNFLNVKDCISSKTGKQYIGITTVVWVKNPKTGTTPNGKRYASAQVALNGCRDTLVYALGPNVPVPAADGANWMTVTVWDNGRGEVDRFMNRFNGFERRNMVLTGALSMKQGTTRNGSPAFFLTMAVDAFRCIDGYKSNAVPQNAYDQPAAPVQAPAAQQGAPVQAAPVQPAPPIQAAASDIAPQGDFLPDLDESGDDVPF